MLQYIATNERTAEQYFDRTAEQYFADQLHAIRTAKGMTQAAIADEMNRRLGGDYLWHQQTVQKIENGTRHLRLDEAVELESILATDLATMIRPTGLDAREVRALIRRTKERMSELERERDRAHEVLARIGDLIAEHRQASILLNQLQAMLREGKN
jgi:transcriptional regulator with XRE-family HTH domain